MRVWVNDDELLRLIHPDKYRKNEINKISSKVKKLSKELKGIEEDDNIEKSFAIASEIMIKSAHYTPVDKGNLLRSMYINKYGKGYEVGYKADYATYVHEIGFNKHKPPEQYKFLEDAAIEVMEKWKSMYGANSLDGINIKIVYDPLKIFVGTSRYNGQSLEEIKTNREIIEKNMTVLSTQVIIDYTSLMVKDRLDERDKALFEIMDNFFEYYSKRKNRPNSLQIAKEFLDRSRHK